MSPTNNYTHKKYCLKSFLTDSESKIEYMNIFGLL